MTEIRLRSFEIINDINEKISGDIRLPAIPKKMPAVFIIHGFKGFRNWGFFPYLSEKIASGGAIAINFDFSMNGKSSGDSDIIEHVEKFAENTMSRQLSDMDLLLERFRNGDILAKDIISESWNGEIYLLGHSLGGAVALLTSKQKSYINKISLWASISTLERYTNRQKAVWRDKGFMEFVNMRTNQTLRLSLAYLDDIENNKEKYNLPEAVSGVNIPIQIIHGTQDMTVPMKEAETLVNAAKRGNLSLHFIPQTGHTFGIDHPMVNSTPALDTAIFQTLTFFGLVD